MGERLRRLVAEAFRAEPESWEIEWPGGASMVVRGDNGTGKSTIADAIEWYFSGRIEFLAREGRERSLRHIGAATARRTAVAVETNGSLGGRQVLPSAGAPWLPSRVPDSFVLRGRTLADFVEKPKAEKFKALAAILGLHEIDSLRRDLQTVRNQLDDAKAAGATNLHQASAALGPAVGTADESSLFRTIQDRCGIAGIRAPSSLDEALDAQWLPAAVCTGPTARAVTLATLAADVDAALSATTAIDGVDLWNDYASCAAPALHEQLRFVSAADALLQAEPDGDDCPLCGQPARRSEIRDRVTRILAELRSASEQHDAAERGLRRTNNAVQIRVRDLEQIRTRAAAAHVELPSPPVAPVTLLGDSLRTGSVVALEPIDAFLSASMSWLTAVRGIIAAVPAPASRDSRLVDLATLCEQGRRWRTARDETAAALRALALAERLHRVCQRTENAKYQAILQAISVRVAELYSALHPSEGLDDVAIEPWTEKGLELVVGFHGSRQRPPHGVLSESHLNSLAVALFLAMAEMFNDRLDVIVLDDIVNSFDVEHRGRLAEMLVSSFRSKQLIVLTHDQQFYLHLARRAPDWLTLELTSWTFEEGPRQSRYATGRLLQSAVQALDDGDVQGAAHKTRRALEELLDEACEATEASLPFRRGQANDRRDLSELMGGLRGRLRSVSRDWYRELEATLTALEADVQAALNIEVHAGPGWTSRAEVESAVARVRALDSTFTCPACGSRIWAMGGRSGARCRCGTSTFPPAVPPA